MKSLKFGILALLTGIALASPAYPGMNDGSCTDTQKGKIVSQHTGFVEGKAISYQAVAGFLEVTAKDKASKACIFYVSYSVASDRARPLIFGFNGGPGSSSVWLHLGLLGPKRVDLGPDGLTLPQSLGLIGNDSSILDVADVVLIDPVATGFSFSQPYGSNDPFFGVENDYTSIAAFIENYITVNNRWLSPKFILGESYGGIRGPFLVNYLQKKLQTEIAGLILLSPGLSAVDFFGVPSNLVPYWTSFPSYAVAAWYHHRIAERYQRLDLESVYKAAEDFARTKYRSALEDGNQVEAKAYDEIVSEYAQFAGLPRELVAKKRMRLTSIDIAENLLGDRGLTVGTYDARMTQADTGTFSDPSNLLMMAYAPAINDYLRTELGFDLQSPYFMFADVHNWPSWTKGSPTVPLVQALADNPRFAVLMASGYYDLTCSMGTVDYELSQILANADITSRIERTRYASGHTLYTNPIVLRQLKSDLAGFIARQAR